MGEDFKTGFERIIRFDQLKLRRAAAEERGEKLFEMALDDIESGEQTFATFLVQSANR